MSHFNDPRDDASHIICNYDGIDLVRGAWCGSAKLDFQNFLLSSRNCNPADTIKHCDTSRFVLLVLCPLSESQNFYLEDVDVSPGCFVLAKPQGMLRDDHLDWHAFHRASFPVMSWDQNTACLLSDWAEHTAWARGPRHSATLRKLARLI